MQCQSTFDIVPVQVKMTPTSKTKVYTVTDEKGEDYDVLQRHLYTEDTVPASGIPSISLGFFKPEWMKQDQEVTLLHHDKYRKGYLALDDDNYWQFVTRGKDGRITLAVPLRDLEYSWKMRLQENTLEIGWQDGLA